MDHERLGWFFEGRPRPRARHDAGVPTVSPRRHVRALPHDGRGLGGERLLGPGPCSTATTRTPSAPARCTSGSIVPPPASGPRAACSPPVDPPSDDRGARRARVPPHPLDGSAVQVRPPRRRARRRRRPRGRGSTTRMHLPPTEPTKIICGAPELREPDRGVHDAPARGADVLPQADHRAEQPQGCGGAARGLQVAELRGRDRHRDRPDRPQRLARRGRRLHRGLHSRQRLRAARLPRHRRRSMLRVKGATPSRPSAPAS